MCAIPVKLLIFINHFIIPSIMRITLCLHMYYYKINICRQLISHKEFVDICLSCEINYIYTLSLIDGQLPRWKRWRNSSLFLLIQRFLLQKYPLQNLKLIFIILFILTYFLIFYKKKGRGEISQIKMFNPNLYIKTKKY